MQDVDLGTFQATYFATSTQSPAVAFVLERKNCSDDLRTLHVRFVGTADSTNASYFAIPTGGVRDWPSDCRVPPARCMHQPTRA